MEFYANAPESQNGRIRIRGVEVNFSTTAINNHYGLLDVGVDDDEYAAFKQEVDYEQVIRIIAKPNTTWNISQSRQMRNFSATKLLQVTRIWQYFICARLMPTKHYSTVDVDRAVLFFAIQRGIRMNVGIIIYYGIQYVAKHTKTGYAFSQLIATLCSAAGVPFADDKILIQPGPLLNRNYMLKVTSGT